MAARFPVPGRRVSLRRVREDGALGDLIGFVRVADAEGVQLVDRRGTEHRLEWPQVLAWRAVGVARGRDPLRTPLADLSRLAEAAGLSGRLFVARLSTLLDGREPASVPDPDAAPPFPALQLGEWVVAAPAGELIALAWWATHRDARSLLLVTNEPAQRRLLLEQGFTERLP